MVIPVSRSTLFVVFPSAFSSISFRLLRSLPEVSVVVDGIVPRVPFLAVAASRLQEDVVDELLPVAFRVEPIACPAFQVEQIFGHVFVQIVFRRGLLFIVPVGIFVHLDWLAVSEACTHFLYTQQVALFVCHPSIVRRVYPEPFAESGRIDGVDDVAVVDIRLRHTGNDTRRNAHRQVALVQYRSQPAAVQAPAAVLAGFSKIDRVVSTLRVAVLSVVTYLVVNISQDTFDGNQFIARHGYTVQLEIVTDTLQVGVISLRIDNLGQTVD